MKILFLTRLFYPHIGGVERHCEKLAQTLIKQNHQVSVVTSQFESSLSETDRFNSIPIYRIPKNSLKSKFKVWSWISHHRNLFSSHDIIHAHDITWWYLPLRFSLSKPIFTTFHGWEGQFPPRVGAKISRKLSEKISLGNICVGDFIAKWYGTKADHITYGATDQQPLEKGSRNRILVLGRLSTDVDIDLTIEALKIIKHTFPAIKITFLGDGDAAWKAQEVGNVLGFQKNISTQLEKAHWVIASSYLSILDALAAGRQVFSAYTNPLKKDYLTSHPMAKYLHPSFTAKILAKNFQTFYQNPEHSFQEISVTQKWALAQTWENLAEVYLKLWQKALIHL